MNCNCIKCGYVWPSRVENPKACPRCKARLDYYYLVKGVMQNG